MLREFCLTSSNPIDEFLLSLTIIRLIFKLLLEELQTLLLPFVIDKRGRRLRRASKDGEAERLISLRQQPRFSFWPQIFNLPIIETKT